MKLEPRVCDLSATLARLGSNVELLREMLELFREDAPIYRDRLNAAVNEMNADAVARAAHSLRGMMCTFEAEAAIQVVRRLEKMGREGDFSCAAALLMELDKEIARLQTTAESELAKL